LSVCNVSDHLLGLLHILDVAFKILRVGRKRSIYHRGRSLMELLLEVLIALELGLRLWLRSDAQAHHVKLTH